MARILVVEDEAPNVEILTRLLKRSGHETQHAGSRDAAIRAVQESPPDLVLMDIGIPNADGEDRNDFGGLEATRWIRQHAATADLPIIALTAFVMPDEKRRILEAGCNDVQSKPFDFAALLETINRELGPS
jgi:two-component system, cell cycle response regulator DivK